MSLTYEELWNEISSGQVLSVDSDFAEDFSQPDSPKNDTDSDDYEDSSSNEEDSYFVIDSDPIERYADITLNQGEVANALESAFNEALAYFKFESTESHFDEQVFPRVFRKKGRRDEVEGFINEIDNFWEGWVDGLEAAAPKPESKAHRLKEHKKIKSSPSKSPASSGSDDIVDIFAFDSFVSSEIEIDVETESYLPALLPVPTVKPTDLLLPVITMKEEKAKPAEPIVTVEVFEDKETKVKRKPSQRKSPKNNKKRKNTSSSDSEESGEDIATKKSKTKRSQNLFKREEVMKIENDGEDEDIDIGDLNDCQ